MAKSISLNDIGGMLNTKGRIDTIGGAIGCMTEMISKDARDKDDTTANDVKKLQEYICGDGGTLKELFDSMSATILLQTQTIQELTDKMKEKRLVKNNVGLIITKMSNSIEKKLDKILDSMGAIRKMQGGKVNWGNTKKTKDSIEKFKEGLNDKKKMGESKFGKFIETLTQLKAIKLKDLITAPLKLKMLTKLKKRVSEFSKDLKMKEIEKVNAFLNVAPKMFTSFKKLIRISRGIKDKGINRIYKVLGIREGKGHPRKSILGMVDSIKNLKKKDLVEASVNMKMINSVILSMCLGITTLVLFTPIILVASLLIKPLEWALFGFGKKRNGGLIGLLRKLGKKKTDIINGNISIGMMCLGFVALGIGIGVLFALTKNIEWMQLLKVTATIAILGAECAVLGMFKGAIKDGAIAMLYMAGGIGILALGIGLMFLVTRNVEWEQLGMMAAAIAGLGIITAILGAINKSGLIFEGSLAMAVMGLALIPFGIALLLVSLSVKGMKWSEFGMMAATLGLFGAAVIGLGALMCTGIGAIAWVAGLAALGALGVVLIPYGISMVLISMAAKKIDKNSIKNMVEATKDLIKGLDESATKKQRRNARKNASALMSIGFSLGILARSLKRFNDVAPDSIDKTINAVTKISDYFFGEGKVTLGGMVSGFFKRSEGKKKADAIGHIARDLKTLSKALKRFNEVGPDSIDKAMNAITRLSDFFFGEANITPGGMLKGFLKRCEGKENADAIGRISKCTYDLAKGLKYFNEVGPDSIDKAMNAISRIAQYFFVELEDVNTDWRKRINAENTAGTIGEISESLGKMGEAIKAFNDTQSGGVDKMIASVKTMVDELFNTSLNVDDDIAEEIEDSLIYLGKGLGRFAEESSNFDVEKGNKMIDFTKIMINDVLANWKSSYKNSADEINGSMKQLITSFEDAGKNFDKRINSVKSMFRIISSPMFMAGNITIREGSRFINKLNRMNVTKAVKLTELFKSFAEVGKAGGIFTRFDKRVKQFTEACVELVNAINGNTEALNGEDEMVTVRNEYGEEEVVSKKEENLYPKQMTITNINELASAIAEQLNSLNVDCDATVNLQINNESGNEWRISRF